MNEKSQFKDPLTAVKTFDANIDNIVLIAKNSNGCLIRTYSF